MWADIKTVVLHLLYNCTAHNIDSSKAQMLHLVWNKATASVTPAVVWHRTATASDTPAVVWHRTATASVTPAVVWHRTATASVTLAVAVL